MPRFTLMGVLLLVLVAVDCSAQGTPDDYRRADDLPQRTRGKVFRDRVQPHWATGAPRFWYRNDLSEDRREFVYVDAEQGARRRLFDHDRLAEALSKATGGRHAAERLDIDAIDLAGMPGAIVFRSADGAWQLDLESYELTATDGPSGDDLPERSPRTGPRASAGNGAETRLTFVNRTDDTVELVWLDEDGNRRSYGTIEAGAERRQHTYGGHVWLILDSEGNELSVFTAADEESRAVITGTPSERTGPPRRRGNRGDGPGGTSPDGRWLVALRDSNVVLINQETDEEHQLTNDGTAEDGFDGRVTWSPDSTHFVVMRTQAGDEHIVNFVESSPDDQLQPKLHSFEYLKPGDQIPIRKPHLFNVETRSEISIDDGLFENPWSVRDLRWHPSSADFTFLYNQRGHQVLRIVAVEAATGAARAIVDEQSATFVDYNSKVFTHFVDGTDELIWMSERDGWNHLYLYDARTGVVKNQITSGLWVVREVDRVDEEARQIWFQAGGIHPDQDPYHIHFCRVDFDGSNLVVLTEGDGTHSVEFSPDREFIVDAYSRVELPPVTELRRSSDGSLVCELERADWSELLATGWSAPERFVAKGRDGETDIYGIIHRPIDFDPERRYPVIEYIYAGPHGSFVPKRFQPYYPQQSLAELGFIVVQIDGMGTNHRSKAFHDVCWRNLGDSGFPDRILWMQAAAEKYPEMDISRVGIYGNSAGGQSALRAMLAHADFYKAAVSSCGCHDNRMDKIWWNELWMGWPIGPHYAEQSNVTNADKLRGDLLLIVGEMDRNVDPASTMQVVDALIKAEKDFDLLVIPGGGHGMGGEYGTRRMRDFFVRHLLGCEPPNRNSD